MKILFANNFYYLRGGSERVFFDEIDLLKKQGHTVIPFSRLFKLNISSEYNQYFGSPIEYENIPIYKKAFIAPNLIYSNENRKMFSKLIKKIKPDLIHAHNIYGRLTSSIIDASKQEHIPVIMTLHDYKLICPSYLMLLNGKICERCNGKYFYNCTRFRCHKGSFFSSAIYTIESYFNNYLKKYECIKYFICPSKFLMEKHTDMGISPQKLIHIPNFLSLNNSKPNYLSEDYILFVGRLSKEKGIITLINSIKNINIKLRIVGDGPLRTELKKYVIDNNINNVIFEGYKNGKELEDLFKKALFLIFPSEWYENLPITILEAFAYGKPVIGSDIGGIPELVINNNTGLLFKPWDKEDLKTKINYMLANPSIISNMGKKAREKVEKEFNASTHYNKLINLYNMAI